MSTKTTILRIFEVKTKPGCAERLLANFETTSAEVVQNEPGNRGYFFGKSIEGDEDVVMFVSVWKDLEAVKARFGEDWQTSFMPNGYEALIDRCSIRHLHVGSDWHVADFSK
ncbi:MAG: antibiotic biosynthesis monooxygenase family protein [Pseudomonadota bacterium]